MIYKSARSLAILLLIINAGGALYGGWSLMIDASGTTLGLPGDWINRLPFHDYFFPGVILFLVNGISSVVAAMAATSRSRGYEKFIVFQGTVLIVWILAQVIMLRTIELLHITMIVMGLTLIALGAILIINRIQNGLGNQA